MVRCSGSKGADGGQVKARSENGQERENLAGEV